MWELTKSFRFEAAHSLKGTTFGAASEEIHGHSFRTEVSVRGKPWYLHRRTADENSAIFRQFDELFDWDTTADCWVPKVEASPILVGYN